MPDPKRIAATLPPAEAFGPMAATPQPSPAVEHWRKPAFILFLLAWLADTVVTALRADIGAFAGWLDLGFLLTAALTTVVGLARRLPLQNSLMAVFVIYCLSGLILAVGAATGVPFGPFAYSDALGGRLFGVLPWTVPLFWVVIIITGRGVARLIMRPWRKTNFYGFWVIGLTCALAVLLDLGLEPFAVEVRGWWLWQARPSPLAWHTAPWVNFLGWFSTGVAVMAFAIPWLINKFPVKQSMDYQPLIQWLLLNGWLIAGNAAHGLWLPVGVAAVGNAIVTVFAVRGARW